MNEAASRYPSFPGWTPLGRAIAFGLASTSILSLLVQMYGLGSMRLFTCFVFLPALVVLIALALWDRQRGDGIFGRNVFLGAVAGLIAAVAYDIFRLPFVFARQWHLTSVIPAMPLFKVFPGFGAMILGQAPGQASLPLAAHVVGWAYHFSNGMTFGIMYLALLGDARRSRWMWGMAFAVFLEAMMLITPYTSFFDIAPTWKFVTVTMLAHAIFGVVMGLLIQARAMRWSGAR